MHWEQKKCSRMKKNVQLAGTSVKSVNQSALKQLTFKTSRLNWAIEFFSHRCVRENTKKIIQLYIVWTQFKIEKLYIYRIVSLSRYYRQLQTIMIRTIVRKNWEETTKSPRKMGTMGIFKLIFFYVFLCSHSYHCHIVYTITIGVDVGIVFIGTISVLVIEYRWNRAQFQHFLLTPKSKIRIREVSLAYCTILICILTGNVLLFNCIQPLCTPNSIRGYSVEG